MNLQEFIDYKSNCPLCEVPLTTIYHSSKWQNMRYEDDRIIVIFRLDSLSKSQPNYKVGYSFNLKDNSWYVEFYTQNSERFETDVPIFLLDRFKELDKNLNRIYVFMRKCDGCCRYRYSSNRFSLDYQANNIGEINVADEYFGLSQPSGNEYKIYILHNQYDDNCCNLSCGKFLDEKLARYDTVGIGFGFVKITGTIKFSSQEETMNRINKLLVFS